MVIILACLLLGFGIAIIILLFRLMVITHHLDMVIDVRDITYSFKIMEIKPHGSSFILKSIDSIQIKLNGNDFNFHNPKIGNIFVMTRTGTIIILPTPLIS